jgi:hypothetical protein
MLYHLDNLSISHVLKCCKASEGEMVHSGPPTSIIDANWNACHGANI